MQNPTAILTWSAVKSDASVSRFEFQEAMTEKGMIRIERNDTDPYEDHFHVVLNGVCSGTREDISDARVLATAVAFN